MTKSPTLGIVGLGNMGGAILEGGLKAKVLSRSKVRFLKHTAGIDRKATQRHRIKACDAKTLCEKSDIILLAVKPQDMKTVLSKIAPHLDRHLVITVAAGLETSFYKKNLGNKISLIRALPNTPSLLGQGATAFFCSKTVTKAERQFFEELFSALGLVLEVKKENLMHAVIAVSASGPAFFYEYAQTVLENGQNLGLTKKQAQDLAWQTFKGSMAMLEHSGLTPKQLIKQVSSKGGTTEAGLKALAKKGFTRALSNCMTAAAKRSKELGKTQKGRS